MFAQIIYKSIDEREKKNTENEIEKRLLDLIAGLLHASCSIIMELAVCPTV